MQKNRRSAAQSERVQWSINDFCRDLGKSQQWFFDLPQEYRPHAVKLGKCVAIYESPRAYLERMAGLGGVPPRTQRPAEQALQPEGRA